MGPESDTPDVAIAHPDKVLFPEDGITKKELMDYYMFIAPRMLPHLTSRPLVMQRFPDGLNGAGVFQKRVPAYFPSFIERVTVKTEKGTEDLVVCNDRRAMSYLANQACITPHIWLSRTDALRHPDWLIFDLDPATADLEPLRRAAKALREILAQVGLTANVKSTGARGLHIHVALDRQATFDVVRTFAADVARLMASRWPHDFTVEQRKSKRGNRLYLDVGRNAYAQTAVSAYAVRARSHAPVAVPLTWEELDDVDFSPGRYTIRNTAERVRSQPEPWTAIGDGQSLAEARQRLGAIGQATGRHRGP